MADKKIPKLNLLSERKKKEASDLLKFYKYIYQCNSCGNLYGCDKHEKLVLCPVCELKLKGKKNEKEKR